MTKTIENPAGLHHKAFSSDVTVNEGERAVTAKISTSAVDRDGEVLIPMGMNSKDFEKNPIVFLNHDYYTLPIGKVVALKRDETTVTAKVVFAARPAGHPEGEEWPPDTILHLFQEGVLKGFSVGFMPLESRPATQKDMDKFGGECSRVFNKWALLELSVAPLPANQEAVALAVSKGFSAETAEKLFGKMEAAENNKPDAQLDGRQPSAREEGYQPSSVRPAFSVHREISMPAPVVKRIHRTVTFEAPKPSVKKLVIAEMSKRAGKLYI
jgi:HK97 family phage prohead protease